MKTFLSLFLFSAQMFAQTLTIPARTVTTTITSGGKSAQATIAIPAQTVTLPATTGGGSSGLPSGLTFTGGVFTVQGSIQATSISLTGGPALPTCATNLYLWKFVAGSGTGSLQPACYVLPLLTLP